MTKPALDLSILSGDRTSPSSAVPRPRFRAVTRIGLPLAIVIVTVSLLLYSARDVLRSTVDVRVMPVVVKPRSLSAGNGAATGNASTKRVVVAQAPGWIEPDPFPISVAALIEGVVSQVHVLEGEQVERGQPVVSLIDDDARLTVRRAEAELAQRRSEVDLARIAVIAAEARYDELKDEVDRKRELVAAGGVSEGEFVRLTHRLRALEGEAKSAKAAVALAETGVARQEVVVDEARLMLERTVIRAPMSGVVLSRSVEPGTRISMAGAGSGEAHMPGVIRLYDPARLQVRADVPLADAAKIGLDTRAEITTEAAPDAVFHGAVTRLVHQADIQRNTVQVKVAVENPSSILKPEMLARVRFIGSAANSASAREDAGHPLTEESGVRILAPMACLLEQRDGNARVWVIELSATRDRMIAAQREVALGEAQEDGFIEITRGLRPGDRVIVDPPANLVEGSRVKVIEEQ